LLKVRPLGGQLIASLYGLTVGLGGCVWQSAQATPQQISSRLAVEPGARLLVVTPHPDDEVLGAGGLMQAVRAGQGTVRVVYLTDGEGFPAGARIEDHRRVQVPRDYQEYGRRRQQEARPALGVLGIESQALTFLSFPNNGLNRLMTKYWSERRAAFRSPYTRLSRPPAAESSEPDTAYHGEDLSEELAQIIGAFSPTMIVVTREEDQHVDHCAAWFFVADALTDVQRVHPAFHADLLTYIIHFYSWPFGDDGPALQPPPGLPGGVAGWLTLPLTPDQRDAKRHALHEYKSQVAVMGWFLDGFARTNEVFSRPAPPHIALPVRNNPCDAFIDPKLKP
jgi:LmbE family N-acetylglucosaminyl deacetylase